MKKLKIAWLYPDLMSTYGDRGNIIVLKKRSEARSIEADVLELSIGFDEEELKKCNLIFMGGAQDIQQEIVSEDLRKKSKTLKKLVEEGVPGLFICGAYQFLGNYYKEASGNIIEGLKILDLYTENPGEKEERLIGDIVFESRILGNYKVIGFENHGGRTFLGEKVKPFGKVLKGFGNNGEDKMEGCVYRNSFGTYLHGPILPKNPVLADYLLEKALDSKLKKLDDSLEEKARNSIAPRLQVSL